MGKRDKVRKKRGGEGRKREMKARKATGWGRTENVEEE